MATPAPEGPRQGLVGNVIGLWTGPAESFRSILRAPQVLLPLVALIALQLAFTGVWLHHVDPAEFMKAQMEESGQWEKMQPEQRAGVLEGQTKFLPIIGWVGAAVGAPLFVLVVGGLYLFVFRFFHGSELTLKPSLSIVAHTFLAVGLITTPLTLLVLFLRDDWTLNPQVAIQANLSLLLDREEAPKFLWSLAESLDLFSFWTLWLLATGYAAASSRPWTWALPGVLGPWALYVACKVVWAALF